MKKIVTTPIYIVTVSICLMFLSGCIRDKCNRTYKIYRPIYKSLTQVRADMKSGQPQSVQNTGKLYLYGKYIFLNEINKGIHVIDNSNPAQPVNTGFINIPGNVDLAVRGNYLYADSYSELVVFDISTPTSISAKKFVEKAFPHRASIYNTTTTSNPDSVLVVVGYNEKDTTVDCEIYSRWTSCANCMQLEGAGRGFSVSAAAAPQVGKGGSMARFTIINNYLYSVSNSELKAFNISNATEPQLSSTKNIGWNIETIYPFNNKLFIGSATGMFIYDVANPSAPSLLSQFSHVRSCDPVIADDKNAFVTLRSGTACAGFNNQLEVLNITNLTQPYLLKIYQLTNPHGLSKDGNTLFVCDGKDGLKIFDATDVNNMTLFKTIAGMETYDVIADNGIALVVARDGLYQYDYKDLNNIKQISKISLDK